MQKSFLGSAMFKIFAAKSTFLKCNSGSINFVQIFPRLIKFNESRRVNSVNFSILESLKNVVKDNFGGLPLSCLDNRAWKRENSKPEKNSFSVSYSIKAGKVRNICLMDIYLILL